MKDLKEREHLFGLSVKEYVGTYPNPMLVEFFYYWTEPNKSGSKMRFELEKTWDLKRRLKRWADNNLKWGKNGRTHQQASSGGGTIVRKSAGAEQLIGILKDEIRTNTGGK